MNNQRNYWIGGIVLVLLIILGIWAWKANTGPAAGTASSTPSGSTMMLPYGPVTLALGQQGVFQGITITPLTVAEDSRCAAGVQCVQAGTVRVLVHSDLSTGESRQDVISLGSTTPVGTFTVGLTAVDPAAQASVKIGNGDYRFTFEVHESAASGAGLQGKG